MRVKIKDICKIISGGDRPSIVCDTQTDECNIPIYGNALDKEGLYGFTNYPVVNEEAVTIAARGSNCGISFLRETPFVPIVRLLILIPNREKILPKYLYYIIKNQNFKSTGSGQPQITIPQISEYEMDIIEEINKQKNISTILYAIDKKIKLNNKINSELENMAKTVYDYWFLQFEFPNDEGKPYKSSGGKMVWNEELKKEIPDGFKIENLENFCRIFTGKKDVNQALEKGKYKFFSCSPNYKYSNEKIYEGKAILISGNGSYTGRTILVNDAIDLYQRTYACVLKNNLNCIEYFYYTLLKFVFCK